MNIDLTNAPEPHVVKLPRATRLAIILGSAIVLWGAIATAAHALI